MEKVDKDAVKAVKKCQGLCHKWEPEKWLISTDKVSHKYTYLIDR